MASPQSENTAKFTQAFSQECKELMPSLPRDEGWLTTYEYQGSWYYARSLEGVVSCHKHFQAKDFDVFLAGIPKSDTTWLKAIMFTLLNRKRYLFLHMITLSWATILMTWCLCWSTICLMVIRSLISSLCLLRGSLALTCLMFRFESCSRIALAINKVVYLCRDPKDNLVSLWNFVNKMMPQDTIPIGEMFNKFCKGTNAFGPYWDHVLEYWKRSKEKPEMFMFMFLSHEDMKEKPEFHLRRLAEFLNCPFSTEEEEFGMVEQIIKLCSFDNLSNLDVNKNGKRPTGVDKSSFFHWGQVGGWKNHLTSEMVEKLDQITQDKFITSGLLT